MSTTTPRMEFPLLSSTHSDVEAIATLTVAACASDRLSVPFQWTTPQSQHLAIISFLSKIFDDPTWEVTKAVHPTTGEIVGWGAAKLQPTDWASPPSLTKDQEKKKAETENENEKGKEATAKVAEKADDGAPTPFFQFLSKHQRELQEAWLSGRRWLYLCALFVAPEWQGKGVGTAVIEKLCERADSEGVPGFLQGLRGATGFYESRGWKCVERFEVDLGKWAEGEGMGYGVYWVSFRLRLPKEKASGDVKKVEQ